MGVFWLVAFWGCELGWITGARLATNENVGGVAESGGRLYINGGRIANTFQLDSERSIWLNSFCVLKWPQKLTLLLLHVKIMELEKMGSCHGG